MRRILAAAALIAAAAPALAAPPMGPARQLTFEGLRAGEGYFSADGTRMIFQSEREPGNPFYQIYLMDLQTGDVARLSPGVGKTTCGWLHPDGERALYASTEFDPEAEAKQAAELEFRASGQTRRYAWDYDPAFDLVEVDIDTGARRRIDDAWGYDAEGAYSPDGRRIAFASNRHAYAAELSAEDAARLERDPAYFMDIYVMDADGSNLRRVTDAPGYDGGVFWSADGEKLTWRRFSEDGASAEVYTLAMDGRGERRVTDLGVMSWAPFFHPSGEYLIFTTNLQGFANFELYIVDVAGERTPVRVTAREGFDGLPAFSPDGETLTWTSSATPDRRSQIFLADWDHQAALAMLAAAPPRQGATGPLEGTDAAIRAEDLRRQVAALTAPEMAGRLTGTEGERAATQYVADVFAALGLAPAGDDGGWFQPFDFTAGVALGPDNALRLSVDGEESALALDTAWRPLGFSRRGPAAQGPVAFAGYGLVSGGEGVADPIDSYDGLDVAGDWVLMWRGMPADIAPERRMALSRFADMRYKASVAKSRGAAGVIFAPPPGLEQADALPRLAYEAISGEAGLPVVAVDGPTATRMLAVLGDALPDLTAAAQAGGPAARDLIGVALEGAVDLSFERRTGRNVLGRLALGPGDMPPVVVGAHVDHLGFGETSGSLARGDERGALHPGADDNASGVAAIIEAAQTLAALREAGELSAPRDIVFAAWSGEELGLLGATHYVDALAEANGADDLRDLVSAYINLDMVGRLEDRLIVAGLGSSDVWAREVERRNAVVGLPIVTSQDTAMPTDSTAFHTARVPILSLFTGAHEDYHPPRDTADKLNFEGLRDVARFTALVARARALAVDEPAWLETEQPSREGGRRMSGVFLGTIPDYATEGASGVPISGAVKGGPAEQAGLRGGDVLVGLAGQELENIYDYVRALNGLAAGRTVDITVLRDGERLTLPITPQLRN